MQRLQFVPADPLQELGRLRTTIGMEAISMTGIASAFTNFFPAMRDNFAKYAANFAQAEDAIALKADERKFIDLVGKHQYLNLVDLTAFVPEGMSVPYLDYLAALTEAVEHCETTTMKTLNDFSLMVSQIVTNRTTKSSMPSNSPQHKKAEITLKGLNERLGFCFGKGSTRTQVTYGDVVGRNTEWKQIIPLMNRSMTAISAISRTALHKKAEECNSLLNSVIRQIKAGEFEQAGPEVVNNLAGGAYQAAMELEFFTAVYYKTASLVNAIGDTMKATTDALNDD